MPLSAQKVPLDRIVRYGNALNTDAKCCLMLVFEPEGARMVVSVEICDRK